MTYQKLPIGFTQNAPGDKNPLVEVPNKFYGGVKTYNNKVEMFDEPVEFLKAGSTMAIVRDGGNGRPNIFVLESLPGSPPASAPYTSDDNWASANFGEVSGGLNPKGTFDAATFDPTTHPTDALADVGDFWVVINADAGVTINNPTIFNGVSTLVYSGDLMIGNGSYFDLVADGTPTLDQIRAADPNFNARIALIMDGGMPTHNQTATTITTSKLVGGTTFTDIESLLAVILYNDSLATTGNPNTEASKLWTYAQLAAIFKDETAINSLIEAYVDANKTGDTDDPSQISGSLLTTVAYINYNFYNKTQIEGLIDDALIEAGIGKSVVAGYNNVVYVSNEYGNDSDADFGDINKPYATIVAATTAARADYDAKATRNLVYVLKGTYDEYNIIQNNVDLFAEDGVVVHTGANARSIISDQNEVIDNCRVTGQGIYVHTAHFPGNDMEAINIRRASNFSVEAKVVDSVQPWNSANVSFKISNCQFLTSGLAVHQNKNVTFENCEFLNGIRFPSFLGENTIVNLNNCKSYVPLYNTSNPLNTSLDIYAYDGTFLFRIDIHDSMSSPIDTDSLTDLDAVISAIDTGYTFGGNDGQANPECVGVMFSSNNSGFDIRNVTYNINNFEIHLLRDKTIGVYVSQKRDSGVTELPTVTLSNVRIFDKYGHTDTAAMLTGWGSPATGPMQMMVNGVSHDCVRGEEVIPGLTMIDSTFENLRQSTGGGGTGPTIGEEDQIAVVNGSEDDFTYTDDLRYDSTNGLRVAKPVQSLNGGDVNDRVALIGSTRTLEGYNANNTNTPLTLRSWISNVSHDTGSNVMLDLVIERGVGTAIATRPLFQIRNGSTILLYVTANGLFGFQNRRIINVADPINNQDVATKGWVLANAGGGAPAYGATKQIPYMNGTNDGFIYSTGLTYDGHRLIAEGASGAGSVAIGYLAKSVGSSQISIGDEAGYSITSGGAYAISIGAGANNVAQTAFGNVIAIGRGAVAVGGNNISLGLFAGATSGANAASSVISIGEGANGSTYNRDMGVYGIAIGVYAASSTTDSIAIGREAGYTTSVASTNYIRIGSFADSGTEAYSLGQYSIAIGYNSVAPSSSGISIGKNASKTTGTVGINVISIGSGANDGSVNIGNNAVAIGVDSLCGAVDGVSIGAGAGSSVTTWNDDAILIGNNAGGSSGVIGNSAVAIGLAADASGVSAIALGRTTDASANYSTVIGRGMETGSAAVYSIVMGSFTSSGSSFDYSHCFAISPGEEAGKAGFFMKTGGGSKLTTSGAGFVSLDEIPVANNYTQNITTTIVCQSTDLAEKATFIISGLFTNNGGTVTQEGTTTVIMSQQSDPNLSAEFTINGTNVEVDVEGITGVTLHWRAKTDVTRVI